MTAPLPFVLANKFRVVRRIGSGGMGVVYEAIDLSLDRAVALKTLPRLDLEGARRLRAEARAMAAVTHPNLAVIYDAESWNGVPILVVELLRGGTLGDLIRTRGNLSAWEAIALGRVLALALVKLHGCGIIHRDIKPSNIGFTEDGAPKLLDFGLARALEIVVEPGGEAPAHGGLTRVPRVGRAVGLGIASGLAGTPLYFPPEAIDGQPPDVSFDLWAFSLVLLEAILGRHPLAQQPPRGGPGMGGWLADLDAWVPGIPSEVGDFFRDALSRDPRRRPRSARELTSRLAAIEQAVTV